MYTPISYMHQKWKKGYYTVKSKRSVSIFSFKALTGPWVLQLCTVLYHKNKTTYWSFMRQYEWSHQLTFSGLSLRWKLGEDICFFRGLWAFLAFLAAGNRKTKNLLNLLMVSDATCWPERATVSFSILIRGWKHQQWNIKNSHDENVRWGWNSGDEL